MIRSVALGALALSASVASADAFDEYGINGKAYTYNLPTIQAGYFTTVAAFPSGAPTINGYALAGRLLAANKSTLYLQKNFGSSVWIPVANIGTTVMDPSFIAISKDGTRIAFAPGYGQKLLFFKSSLLSTTAPTNLLTNANVTQVTADSYDGAWHTDNRTFFFNGGALVGGVYSSGVMRVTLAATPNNPTLSSGPSTAINTIPGASGGIAVASTGRLVTGIGYQTSPNRTGEIKVWSPANVTSMASGTLFNYGTTGKLLANNVLSAAALGFDNEGNLHVGGGDAYGVGGASENGYAALIRASVVTSVLGTGSPVNEASAAQYVELIPDPCEDDSSTSPITFSTQTRGLTIAWNPSGNGGACYAAGSADDLWEIGVTPKITQYYGNGAPDFDGDGRPDGSDNAWRTANANQRDTDGDGFGNIADCDLNNDGVVNGSDQILLNAAKAPNPYNQHADFNGDGLVNNADQTIFNGRNGTSAPWY